MTRREFIGAAAALGYACEPTRGGHLAFRHPSGAVVTAAGTPSDARSWLNALAQMRRELRARGLLKQPTAPAESGTSGRQRREVHRPPPARRPEPPDGPTRLVETIGPDGRRVLTGIVHGLPVTLTAAFEAGRWTWRRSRVEVRR